MVRPKPHWNLFLRWFRKAPMASVRGSGSSFFSNAAPTIQLLSTEPAADSRVSGTGGAGAQGTEGKGGLGLPYL